MTRFLSARVAGLVALTWAVATIAFVLAHAAPGDPAELFLERAQGRPPTAAQLEAMRRQMGLDRPVLVQYGAWIAQAARGDFGRSWTSGEPVAASLAAHLPPTIALALTALAMALGLSVPLGVAAAARPGGAIDRLSRVLAVGGASIPAYVLGYLLILAFAVRLGLLPVFGGGSPAHVVLPAATLAFAVSSTYARLIRASVLAALTEDYIRAARAKGLSRRAVLVRHALPNAALPLLTVAAVSLGHLLGGAIIVEWVFAWPGVGRLAVDAIAARDYPLVQGVIVLSGVVFGVVNLAADVAYAWIDPRVRLAGARRP